MIFTFMTFNRHLCPRQLTVIHTLMAVAAMQHIRSSLRFSIFPEDTLTCRPEESDQQPFNNKTLALPLSQCEIVSVQYEADAH